MRILIIGGTGNISTPITNQLLEKGHNVVLYNRGSKAWGNSPNTEQILGNRKDYSDFGQKMSRAGDFDCVIDMLCFDANDAESSVSAFKGRTGQYIVCSSVDAYTRDIKSYPIREDSGYTSNRYFFFGYKKAQCEKIFLDEFNRDKFPVTIIRPAQTYSEGYKLLNQPFKWGTYLLDRLMKGKPIILHGDGQGLWGACHSEDVAGAFAGAAGNVKTLGKGYNVAADEWLTWNQMWESTAEVMGAPKPKFVHIPTDLLSRLRPELTSLCAMEYQYPKIYDTTAAKEDLGFKYTITWKDGVRRCVEWFRANGGFDDSDSYRSYDQFIQAWEEGIKKMSTELVRFNRMTD